MSAAAHSGGMRIARFLAAVGLGSRRACEHIVGAGRVTVNGEPVTTPACTVEPGVDDVRLDGRALALPPRHYLVLYKPRGVTCSARDRHAQQLVTELLPPRYGRLFSVGRLDRESEGVLLLTNDGKFAQRLAHPRHGVIKRYRVHCRGAVRERVLSRLRAGVNDRGERLQPQKVELVSAGAESAVLRFWLGEGRKREIRRLCGACGLRVERLVRESVGGVTAAGLRPGEYRELSAAEREQLDAGPPAPPPQRADREHS